MPKAHRKRQVWIYGVLVVLTAAGAFTLGSLPLHAFVYPVQGTTYAIFFALSLIFASAFLVFGLILARSLVRLAAERRSGQMGSRFKVKMVLGAMGISLLPVVFMFIFSYALVNRTLNAWFPRPLEIANEQSQVLLSDLEKTEFMRLSDIASQAASHAVPDQLFMDLSHAVDAFWIVDSHGKVAAGVDFKQAPSNNLATSSTTSITPTLAQTIASGAQVWKSGGSSISRAMRRSKMGRCTPRATYRAIFSIGTLKSGRKPICTPSNARICALTNGRF